MKKHRILIYIILLLIISLQPISATTIFLTSDHVGSDENDLNMLNSVKKHIEELSDGSIEVIIDDEAPNPGEGTRALQSSADVSVTFAACCAGNFLTLAKGVQNSDKQIIFVNTGDFDLDNEEYIRRAWDDDYSSVYFAGITNPGNFLRRAGIEYIQPLKEYPNAGESYTSSDDNINRYIAEQIVQKVNNKSSPKTYDESLIVTHNMHPSEMAEASTKLVESNSDTFEDSYNSMSAPQLLYLTSSYLNGNSLSAVSEYDYPSDIFEFSLMTKSSYSIYDYMKMAGIVKNYMDENNKAPGYIYYEGAIISYYDLTYNFAKITENHTDMESMNFDSSYSFEKVHNSILIDILPIVIILLALLLIYKLFSRFKKKKRYRR